ncbi:MAG: CO dehydrogenase/acetyl-CoA synthase subunit delta, partial [Nitrososphaerales archaeon]
MAGGNDDINELVKKVADLVQKFEEIEIENVELSTEELRIIIQPLVQTAIKRAEAALKVEEKPPELIKATFTPYLEKFHGQIAEVQLGATKSEGGTRGKTLKIGGEKTMPFYSFEASNPNKPVFAMDVFDMPITLTKPVKQMVEDVMHDPAEWAKKCVNKYGAQVVSLNLVSTDPLLEDRPIQQAMKSVENVLQAVDVPIIIGGSGNPQKDPLVLSAAAEVAHGEKVVLNSVTIEMDYKRVVKACKEHGHALVSFTPMDVNNQKRLNRLLLDEGLPKNQIVQDPTTAALGYGLEYAFSLEERIKLAGLMGDEDLQMPILAAASNAWGARESWMKVEEWGPREIRGPLWETVTCVALMMAGADLFMISHPATIRVAKKLADSLFGEGVCE